VAWCSDHGLPHSTLLTWSPEDRAKLTAHLMESSQRCQMCGTSQWEWDQDKHAYEGAINECRGCMIKDAAQEDVQSSAGRTVVLVPTRVADARRAAGQRSEAANDV
jgi:hypothetical protein